MPHLEPAEYLLEKNFFCTADAEENYTIADLLTFGWVAWPSAKVTNFDPSGLLYQLSHRIIQ